jgi:hypothetical protein
LKIGLEREVGLTGSWEVAGFWELKTLAGRRFADDKEIHLFISAIATHECHDWHCEGKGNVFTGGLILRV